MCCSTWKKRPIMKRLPALSGSGCGKWQVLQTFLNQSRCETAWRLRSITSFSPRQSRLLRTSLPTSSPSTETAEQTDGSEFCHRMDRDDLESPDRLHEDQP